MCVGSSSGGSVVCGGESVGPLSVHGLAESLASDGHLSHLHTFRLPEVEAIFSPVTPGIHFIVAVVDVCVSEDSEFWLRGLVALSALVICPDSTRRSAVIRTVVLDDARIAEGGGRAGDEVLTVGNRSAKRCSPETLCASVRLAFSNLGLVVGIYTISICSFTISSVPYARIPRNKTMFVPSFLFI
ncbi:hypothetical protein DFH11DRAFT_1641309 [Phellopilus nigrolimitatus]|nr:hypothetical protein DFH11DRAFT_1641309 [Phellopilus nigrolimitatus]